MTIRHHPAEGALMGYASGALEQPFRLAVAAHLDMCVLCRKEVALWEGVGAAFLENIEPAEMTGGALENALAAIDREGLRPARATAAARPSSDAFWLPPSLRGMRIGREFPIGPGIRKRNIWRAGRGAGRAFLLRGRPGLELPRHGHEGVEMTYVVQGGYSDGHGHYGPGDLLTADVGHSHQPRVDDDGECVLLIASEGRPQATGLVGLMMRLLM
jgi:putative transcriptional regulator